jgi:hypothetical protein
LIDPGHNPPVSRRWIVLVVSALVLNASLWLATSGLGGALDAVQNQLFGSSMVRAEVVVQEPDGLHDIRVDRGKIVSVSGSSLTLKEKDASVVTLSVSPAVSVQLNGVTRQMRALRPGYRVQWALRDGDGPVTRIVAFTR